MGISPSEIESIIKKHHPSVKVRVLNHGPAPLASKIIRYSIETHVFGANVRFNLGENLTMLIDGAPAEIIKHAPLLNPDDMATRVDSWIRDMTKYLETKEIPIVSHFSKKYLGGEVRVDKRHNVLFIYFDKFHVSVTPSLAAVLLNSDNRTVFFKKFENETQLESFFKDSAYFAKAIREGKL